MRRFVTALTFLLVGSLCWEHACAQCNAGQCQLLDSCYTDADCAPGLFCSSCVVSSILTPKCIRDRTTALPNITSLAFNKVAWITTHNSFAIVDAPELTGTRITFYNQEDSVTDQLNNGVRGLMLDMYDFRNDIWLCHSFGGKCLDITSFAPALDTVKEIMTFLDNNPSEIVTIFIEDYVSTVNGITNVFRAAGIDRYLFPVASMPTPGSDWPTIGTMIANNWRFVVFTSRSSKQASEGLAYQWNFVDENQYGDDGLIEGKCSNRAESQFLNSTRNTLIVQNFFHTNPVQATTCRDNSQDLYDQLDSCFASSSNRWANFLAVDFYKRSTGGGVFQALDKLNGQMQCRCNNPISCQTRTTPGQCPSDFNLSVAAAPESSGISDKEPQNAVPSAPGPAMESSADKCTPWFAFLAFLCWANVHGHDYFGHTISTPI